MKSSAEEIAELQYRYLNSGPFLRARLAMEEFIRHVGVGLQEYVEDMGLVRGLDDPPMPMPPRYYRSR